MDKARIKKFSQYARSKLIPQMQDMIDFWMGAEEVSGGLRIGTQFFNDSKQEQYTLARKSLIQEVERYGKESVADHAAYTRFNRIIALRYMELHGYLPINSSLFVSSDGSQTPDIVKNALHEYTNCGLEESLVLDLESKHNYPELYRFMFIGVCNKLSDKYGFLFSKIDDWSVLLFPKDILTTNHIIKDSSSGLLQIPDKDWQEVEIIGWMYQYYISEKKEELFEAAKKKSKKFGKDELTAVTQLFTPKWIVQYMVQNTVGKTWLQSNTDESLQSKWKFYIQEKDDNHITITDPKELTILDPACGSGHILVTAFDVLFDIYLNSGYARGSIPQLIIENNLYGFEVCERAHQLSCFAVLMKAKGHDSDIQQKVNITNHIICIEENNNFEKIDEDKYPNLRNFIKNRYNASIYGSLINVNSFDEQVIYKEYASFSKAGGMFADGVINKSQLEKLIHQGNLMSNLYVCTVANPPYMGGGNMDDKIKQFVIKNYPELKADLFAPFVYKCLGYTLADGKVGLMTPFVWMFIKSYEYLRNYIITNNHLASLVKPSYTAFFESAIVPLCSYCIEKHNSHSNGLYFDLGYLGGADEQEPKFLEAIRYPDKVDYRYERDQYGFEKIPGSPIVCWASDRVLNVFKDNKIIHDVFDVRQGMSTANNELFLRFWFEIPYLEIGLNIKSRSEAKESGLKRFIHNKGGGYRKYSGNLEYVVNFQNDGKAVKQYVTDRYPYLNGNTDFVVKNQDFFFKPAVTRSKITSSGLSFRYVSEGTIFNDAGPCIFSKDESVYYYLVGLLNSKVIQKITSSINPTMNFNIGDIEVIPFIKGDVKNEQILVNINISKSDRDLRETSWDFQQNPLIANKKDTLESSYQTFCNTWTENFFQLHANEEELNRQFISIYGLQDEITPDVSLNEITILQNELETKKLKENSSDIIKSHQLPRKRDVIAKQLMSYIVGCIMGRYSLDVPGLAYAGGKRDPSKYKTFLPDGDDVVPVLEDTYFDDDIVERTKAFVKTVRGEEQFGENRKRLAQALDAESTKSSEVVIREYRCKKFMDDHYTTYSKRPIYWYFASSPKKGKAAFQAIVYLHRISSETISRLRYDYVHKFQAKLEAEYESLKASADRKSEKRMSQIVSIQAELAEYDKRLKNFADKNITLDLDDGVKHNYGLLMKEGIVAEYKL